MSLEQKIVYTGLSRMTQDRAVIQNAFQFWQANHSNKAFDVVEVTTAIEKYLGLGGGEKKVLMIALHAASTKTDSELSDVPGYILQGGAAPAPVAQGEAAPAVTAPTKSPHYTITAEFINLLGANIKRSNPQEFRELFAILSDEGLPELSAESNKRVKKSGFSPEMLAVTADVEDCKEIAHQMYLLIIDVVGPVDADVLVNRVIDKLLQNELAGRFDPRSLI